MLSGYTEPAAIILIAKFNSFDSFFKSKDKHIGNFNPIFREGGESINKLQFETNGKVNVNMFF